MPSWHRYRNGGSTNQRAFHAVVSDFLPKSQYLNARDRPACRPVLPYRRHCAERCAGRHLNSAFGPCSEDAFIRYRTSWSKGLYIWFKVVAITEIIHKRQKEARRRYPYRQKRGSHAHSSRNRDAYSFVKKGKVEHLTRAIFFS